MQSSPRSWTGRIRTKAAARPLPHFAPPTWALGAEELRIHEHGAGIPSDRDPRYLKGMPQISRIERRYRDNSWR